MRRPLPDVEGIAATRLFTHKDDCTRLNESKLKELPGKQHTFTARDTSVDENALQTLRAGCSAPTALTLKPDTQVRTWPPPKVPSLTPRYPT